MASDGESAGKVKVLQLAGVGRSGTTLLARLLGQADGVFSPAEIRHLWRAGFVIDAPCGCGEKITRCDFWRAVFAEAFGGQFDGARVEMLRRSIDHIRFAPLLLSPRRPRAFQKRVDEYVSILEQLYPAIQKIANCELIIDSSGNPVYGLILDQVKTIDLSLVHLVRDSRAVAFSMQRKKRQPAFGEEVRFMYRRPPPLAVGIWNVYNLLTALRTRRHPSLLVHYEELANHPKEVVGRVLSHGLGRSTVPDYISGDQAAISMAHTAYGNPMRFDQGVLQIKPDEEWRTKMSPLSRILVTVLTSPLLLRFGYLGGPKTGLSH